MKPCFRCHQELPLASFYAHPAMKDGHLNKCKECCKAEELARRLANPEEYRAKQRERSAKPERQEYSRQLWHRIKHLPQYVEKSRRHGRQSRLVNPDKTKARAAVNNAIRAGRLIRQSCEKCGARAHAHHEDYSRPLEVLWLCARHHQEHHNGTSG